MATVTIRIDDDTRDELEEIAHSRGVTLSDLLREQIDGLLGREVPMRDGTPHTMSVQQRLLLAQQHEILAWLSAGSDYESKHHHDMVKLLREGYAGEYGALFAGIYSEMSRSECKLTWDILDMFSMLQMSIERLSGDDRKALGEDTARRLRYRGFDMNDSRECRMLMYVRYLVDAGRWKDLRPRLAEIGDGGNSHMPCLASYERMLAVYTPISEQITGGERGYSWEERLLTVDDLRQVAGAFAYPSNR
jgi:uncharacterized protein